jgi:hypothetical protein
MFTWRRRLGHMFLIIPFNMFYYIALKYGNFLLETLDTFPLLKDAYTQSRKVLVAGSTGLFNKPNSVRICCNGR